VTRPRRRPPICSPTTLEDRAVVDRFRAYLKAQRDAEARGTRICRTPPNTETGWPCTHDVHHDGPHTWEPTP
jgi:hypothetical protein